MKDAYSFDRDEEGLDGAFRAHAGAYERIFERCGLDVVAVEAESGMMGGTESMDYLAPSGSGENTLVTCESGDYAADLEIARGVPRPRRSRSGSPRPPRWRRRAITTCEDLAGFLGIDLAATSKAMPVVADGEGRARARPRRRPSRRGQARGRRRERRAAGADGRDRRGVRRRARLPRPRRVRRRDRARRDAARGAVRRRREPHRLPPARRRARARLRGAVRRHPDPARGRRVPAVRRRARSFAPRSRSVTSSSSARSTPCRSTRCTSTSSRWSARS